MRYLFLLTQIESAWAQAPAGEPERVFEQYQELEKELKAKGKFVESVRLRPRFEAKTLRNQPKGDRVMQTGAFANMEESIGGFYILKCESMDEAVQWAQKMPNYGHGSVEIRPIWD